MVWWLHVDNDEAKVRYEVDTRIEMEVPGANDGLRLSCDLPANVLQMSANAMIKGIAQPRGAPHCATVSATESLGSAAREGVAPHPPTDGESNKGLDSPSSRRQMVRSLQDETLQGRIGVVTLALSQMPMDVTWVFAGGQTGERFVD
ncbi:hypothetical protein G7046_g1692 [Stylonectria norvegica]|nr:hypothetical protein G7046_g1692 [Stylonectria norvegica]